MRKKCTGVLGGIALCILLTQGVCADEGAGVVYSSSAFVHESGVVFWGWNNALCSGLMDEEGSVYDFVKEGTMPDQINDVAIDGNDLYLGTFDGIFRMNLEEYQQENTQAQMLCDGSAIYGFQICDGYLYSRLGDGVRRIQLDSLEAEEILTGISDYQVMEDGICYADGDGGLFFVEHDGTGREFWADTAAETKIVLHGDKVYYWGEEESHLHCYSRETGASADIPLSGELYPKEYVWVTDDYLVYTAADKGKTVYKYYFEDGREETLDELYSLPDREEGMLRDGVIYSAVVGTIYWEDIQDNTDGSADMDEILGGDEEAISGVEQDAAVQDGYDIGKNAAIHVSEGNAFFGNDYFQLYLPADVGWDYESVDSQTVRFFMTDAKNGGFGGTFLTIEAFDWGDNGYEDWPACRVAGVSGEKKYVALFPTDLQYDPQSEEQMTAYQRLRDLVERIGPESPDNPFIVLNP